MIDLVKTNRIKASISFRIIYLINFIFISLSVYLLPISFETNDDAMMMLLASGQYTGKPEVFLVFINVIYGYLLSAFYQLLPSFSWYTIFFLALHYFSLNILSKMILKQNQTIWTKLIFLAFLYLIEINNINSLQFTTTASITALAGLACILENRQTKYFGIILFCLASLIRFEAALLVLLVFCPAFLIDFLQLIKCVFKGKLKVLIKSKLTTLILTLLCVLSLQLIAKGLLINNKAYTSYYAYNVIRGKIHDNPLADKIGNNLPTGISKTDFNVFKQFIIDVNIFSLEKIALIENSITKFDSDSFSFTGLNYLFNNYLKYFICITCLTILLIKSNNGPIKKISMALSLIIFLVASALISINGIYKYRVFVSALLPLFFVITSNYNLSDKGFSIFKTILVAIALITCGSFFVVKLRLIIGLVFIVTCFITKFKQPILIYFTVGFISILMLYVTENIVNNKTTNYLNRIELKKQLDLSNQLNNTNKSLFVLPIRFKVEAIQPLSTVALPNINKLIFSGWLTAHPKKSHGIQQFNTLLQNSFFLINNVDTNIVSDIQDIVKTHYNQKFNTKIVLNNNDYRIIEFELIE
jgi:hypothetical protein